MKKAKWISLILVLCLAVGAVSPVTAGSWSNSIQTVWDSYRSGNTSASSAPQQLVNGTYRTFEISYIIAQILNTDGSYSNAISTVWDSYRSGNTSSSSASQQAVNGAYRSFYALFCFIRPRAPCWRQCRAR